MLKIYAIHHTQEMNPGMFEALMSRVSDEKQRRVKRFLRRMDSQRALLAELLARQAVAFRLGLENRWVAFETNPYGKPFLPGYPDFHFNLSHSGDWVVAAVGEYEVGIDVETIRLPPPPIAQRSFSPAEYAYWCDLPKERQTEAFFELWTLKESYIKAVGQGLSLGLQSFTVQITPQGDLQLANEHPRRYYFKQYPLDGRHKVALCYTAPIVDDVLEILSLDQFSQSVLQTLGTF